MSQKRVTNTCSSNGSDEDIQEVSIHRCQWELSLGSFIWVKIAKNAWWPAQVLDEDAIGKSNKPRNKLMGDILVRLYGSYKYLYVNPIKSQREFEIVLKQNGGSYREIFNNALQQDISSLGSDKSKSRVSKVKGARNLKPTASRKTPSQNGFDQDHKVEPSVVEPSPRRMRVMQSLGLKAPSDSPFCS